MAPYELVVGEVDLTPRPDTLLTLEEAVDLDRLAGQFTPRDLRRYATRRDNPLPTIRPGRHYLTTPAWVDGWIEDLRTCRAPSPRHASTTTGSATHGASSTGASTVWEAVRRMDDPLVRCTSDGRVTIAGGDVEARVREVEAACLLPRVGIEGTWGSHVVRECAGNWGHLIVTPRCLRRDLVDAALRGRHDCGAETFVHHDRTADLMVVMRAARAEAERAAAAGVPASVVDLAWGAFVLMRLDGQVLRIVGLRREEARHLAMAVPGAEHLTDDDWQHDQAVPDRHEIHVAVRRLADVGATLPEVRRLRDAWRREMREEAEAEREEYEGLFR